MKRLLSTDGNQSKVFHYSEHDDTAAIETVTDVAPIMRHVQRMKAAKAKKYDSEVANYVGTVDINLFLKWCESKGVNAQEALADNRYLIQYLNAPENAKFKAVEGKI